ncbi:uncharacterized [Tachysurus ichikawai]
MYVHCNKTQPSFEQCIRNQICPITTSADIEAKAMKARSSAIESLITKLWSRVCALCAVAKGRGRSRLGSPANGSYLRKDTQAAEQMGTVLCPPTAAG